MRGGDSSGSGWYDVRTRNLRCRSKCSKRMRLGDQGILKHRMQFAHEANAQVAMPSRDESCANSDFPSACIAAIAEYRIKAPRCRCEYLREQVTIQTARRVDLGALLIRQLP